ncbi:MAG TPA: hypothetical protein VFC23_04135 [Thermoanaerobaculia bacterium]|nr:hypothetical protein [Thermoanaerobaculia bacterium]
MKKQKARKLRLSRETLRSLGEHSLRNADGAAVIAVSFIKPCTNVVSDCYACTGPLDTCPSAQNCPTAYPQCTVA